MLTFRSIAIALALSGAAHAGDVERAGVRHEIPWQPPPIAWPKTNVVREQGEGPRYYRLRKPIVGAGVRPAIKGLGPIAGSDPSRALAFGFDAHIAGRIGIGRGERTFGLWPEAGYVFSGGSGHFASVGLGPAVQTPTPYLAPFPEGLSFGLVPHLLWGVRDDARAVGVRTSWLAEIYFDDGNAWGLEIGHQLTRWNGIESHEVFFGISLTLLAARWDS